MAETKTMTQAISQTSARQRYCCTRNRLETNRQHCTQHFREAVRDRLLYKPRFVCAAAHGAAVFIGELSGGQERR